MTKNTKPKSIRAKIILLFALALLFFLVVYVITFYLFSSSVQHAFVTMNKEYQSSVQEITSKTFEKRELLAFSSLMDEKSERINFVLEDLEKIIEIGSLRVEQALLNHHKRDQKIFSPTDFKTHSQITSTLQNSKKYNVPISLVYPDMIVNNPDEYKSYSFLYWDFKETFSEFYKLYPHILWNYIGFENDGSFLNYPGTFSEPDSYDPRIRSWYKNAVDEKGLVWTKPYFDSGQGSLVITVSKPVYKTDSSQLYAVVGADLLLDGFIEDIVAIDDAYEANFILLSDADEVLYKSDNIQILGDWKKSPELQNFKEIFNEEERKEFLKIPDSKFALFDTKHGKFYVFKRKLEGVNWTLVGLLKKINLDTQYGSTIGHLENFNNIIRAKLDHIISEYYKIIFWLFILVLSLSYFFYKILKRIFVNPMDGMVKMMNSFPIDGVIKEDLEIVHRDDEIGLFAKAFLNLQQKVNAYHEELQHKAHLEVLGEISSQVAHDIRSPLAALDVVTSQLHAIQEEDRTLIRRAVQRIHDIANDLLERQKSSLELNSAAQSDFGVHLLSAQIESLVSEKRLQFKSKFHINISFDVDHESYGIFAVICPADFKRILSNIINNSIEAMDDRGNINLKLQTTFSHATIEIQDQGKGIPPGVLPLLMAKGQSHNKQSGKGLGLYHAKQTIEKWRGHLYITSALNQGTLVRIELPKAPAPGWFVPILELNYGSFVVVLDDDPSVHEVWKKRFSQHIQNNNIFLLHFSNETDFKTWFSTIEKSLESTCQFLVDYELLGSEKTGLKIIEDLEIQKQSILVTSRYEEKEVLERCHKSGLKLIPKGLAGFVPIIIQSYQDQNVVLIDDDELIRELWQNKAKAKNISLVCYESSQAFTENISKYSCQTAIYVDSDLNGQRGEEFVKHLTTNGFLNVTLTTGYPESKFQNMPWITRVIGKTPPW